jgi:hypothetical protein
MPTSENSENNPTSMDVLARANIILAEAMIKEALAINEMAKSKIRFEPGRVHVSMTRKISAQSAPGIIHQYESLELTNGISRSVGDIDMGANSPVETIDEAVTQVFNEVRRKLNDATQAIGITGNI